MSTAVFQAIADSARAGEPVALGIICGAKGSSPQKTGAKALFYGDGRIVGTMGGGCLEAEVQHRAINALRTGRPETFDLLLDHDFGWDDGLVCGGKVEGVILPGVQTLGLDFWEQLAGRKATTRWGVRKDLTIAAEPGAGAGAASAAPADWLYVETVTAPCALWIAGAGHIAQAVAPIALQLDFAVTVFDDRPALVNHAYFPPAVALSADTWERMLATPLPPVPTFGLIITRGHRHDALVLKEWIRRPFVFLGMIGSSRKARTIFEHFIEEKLATAEQLARVACPVGVKIRSRTVPEIAVSILAQYIDKRGELADPGSAEPKPCCGGATV